MTIMLHLMNMARKSFRALRGLVRLQGVVRGQNVKRQTMTAMKHMQLLVSVQTQIQSRRIQMLENQAVQRQAYKNDREADSTLSKWRHLNIRGHFETWKTGVSGPVALHGLDRGKWDMSWQKWTYQVGLKGEAMKPYSPNGVSSVNWMKGSLIAQNQQPLTRHKVVMEM